jgi:hypothetical protein
MDQDGVAWFRADEGDAHLFCAGLSCACLSRAYLGHVVVEQAEHGNGDRLV